LQSKTKGAGVSSSLKVLPKLSEPSKLDKNLLLKTKNIEFNSINKNQNNNKKKSANKDDAKFALARIKLVKAHSESNSPITTTDNRIQEKQEYLRLYELLVNEFQRKKGFSINTLPNKKDKINSLIEFWQTSLSKERIRQKLKTKALKNQPLVEKEKHLLNYLEGTDSQGLLMLNKESTTRRYGELAVLTAEQLAELLTLYII